MLYNEKSVLDNLKLLRNERKYTQGEVSNFLGMARGSYAKIENGINKMNLENALKLANLYNVTVDELLCLSNNNNELDTVLKEGITYNGKMLTDTDIIALKAFLQGLTSNKQIRYIIMFIVILASRCYKDKQRHKQHKAPTLCTCFALVLSSCYYTIL